MWWVVLLALVVCVGATNIYNFMDGINGIAGGYSLAILIPLLLMNGGTGVAGEHAEPFIDGSFLVVAILSVLLFCIGKLVLAYVWFMKKYYHLHEEYLASLKK